LEVTPVAPKTAPPEEEADAAEAGPLSLDAIERTGATRFGAAVVKVVVYTADGRKVAVDLPSPAPPPKDYTRTKAGRAILDVLGTEGRPMKGQSIARTAGLEYSGSFRQTLKGLTAAGEIDHDDGEYTLPA
jgi:hypothetical protein